VLFIGGGNSNFTCVKKTFTAILKAVEEYKESLKNTEIWVRRAGPN